MSTYETWGEKIATTPYQFFQRGQPSEKLNVTKTKEISSQPYQLCFCYNDEYYKHIDIYCNEVLNIAIHRGQRFSASLLAKDQLKTSTAQLVTAKTSRTARLKLNQSTQTFKIIALTSHTIYILPKIMRN